LIVKNRKLQPRPLVVGGADAAHGTVIVGSSRRVRGNLEGHNFAVTVSAAVLSRASIPTEWPGQATAALASPGSILAPSPPLARLP
jgi:hypothetical protein